MGKKTNKNYLIDDYAERYGLTKAEAREELDRFPDFVAWELSQRDEVLFSGFFKFQKYEVPERNWKDFEGNFQTSPAKIKVNCKIGGFLKEFLNR